MTFPAIANSQVTADAPADTTLFDELRQRDNHNYDEATGSGIEPTSEAFRTAMAGHTHDGTAGQGLPIPTDGIADDGINDSDMFATGAVTNAKVSTASPMQEAKFAQGAVTPAKMDGGAVLGSSATEFSGSSAIAGGAIDIAHGLGRRPVVTNIGNPSGTAAIEFEIVSTDSTNVRIQSHAFNAIDPFNYKFRCI